MKKKRMNGGQDATRGFLLQTLIALLDLLADAEKLETLRLEPVTSKDKTDFVIEYVGGRKKAVQVKSSINQIGLPAAKKWAKSLMSDLPADQYELCLIGPISGDLAKTTDLDGVAIPTPKSLDVNGMREQASHRLDMYLHKNGMITASPTLRERIVEGLIGKLFVFSTSGTPLKRSDLEAVFRAWVESAEELASKDLKSKYGNGTLTDVDALNEYAAQFDRPALQDSLRNCLSYKRFGESLGELIELVNTGKINGNFVAKRRADFVNLKWREQLNELYQEIRNLRQLYTSLVRSGDIDETSCSCTCPATVVENFEGRKRKVVQLLNRVLLEAGIQPIGVDS